MSKARRNPQVVPEEEPEGTGEDYVSDKDKLAQQNIELQEKNRLQAEQIKVLERLRNDLNGQIRELRSQLSKFTAKHNTPALFPTWRRHQASALLAQWKSM